MQNQGYSDAPSTVQVVIQLHLFSTISMDTEDFIWIIFNSKSFLQ